MLTARAFGVALNLGSGLDTFRGSPVLVCSHVDIYTHLHDDAPSDANRLTHFLWLGCEWLTMQKRLKSARVLQIMCTFGLAMRISDYKKSMQHNAAC